MKFEYFVTVYDDQGDERHWNREVFTTLSGAMKYATKFVRRGWEARIFKSWEASVKTELTPKSKRRTMKPKGKAK
jgi:hypothetical protein